MQGEETIIISKQANELRKSGNHKEALKLYETINEKEINAISGMANCHRKLGQSEKAVKLLNNYMKQNPNIDLKSDENVWLRRELVWSYADYYLNENYTNKEYAIKATYRILEFGEKNNEFLLKRIKKALFSNKELIKKYPQDLKNILDQVDGSSMGYITTLIDIKVHKKRGNNITTNIYYSLILNKMKVLSELKDYKGVLDIYNKMSKDIDDLHMERNMANAEALQENYDKAINMLNNSAVKYGKQYYIYSDIGDIYCLIGEQKEALKNYYKACNLVHEDKFLLSILANIAKLLVDKDSSMAKKHLDLCILIRNKEKWKLKPEEENLLKKLSNLESNEDINLLKKELKKHWNEVVNKDRERFEGTIIKVLENGNGFIRYKNDKQIFFKRNKRYNFKAEDKVKFYIEDSYDKKKGVCSKAATQLVIIKK